MRTWVRTREGRREARRARASMSEREAAPLKGQRGGGRGRGKVNERKEWVRGREERDGISLKKSGEKRARGGGR